jgi:hypothetical protein
MTQQKTTEMRVYGSTATMCIDIVVHHLCPDSQISVSWNVFAGRVNVSRTAGAAREPKGLSIRSALLEHCPLMCFLVGSVIHLGGGGNTEPSCG